MDVVSTLLLVFVLFIADVDGVELRDAAREVGTMTMVIGASRAFS